MEDEINKTIKILRGDGIILYPTDTIWGIGCDATNEQAVAKIFKLKGRDQHKSLIILLADAYQLASYVNHIPEIAYNLIEYTEKPLTIIYSEAKNLASNLIATDGSIGIRIVKQGFCKQLLERFRKPIVSTSANLSGQPHPKQFAEVAQDIRSGVDYVVNHEQDKTATAHPSTIMKLDSSGVFTFIRQ